MNWTKTNAVFPAKDVAASVEWYGRTFGLEPVLVNPPSGVAVYAIVGGDGVALHLLRSDRAPHGLHSPVQARFWIDQGLDELFNQLARAAITVMQAPADQPWGHRDFMVADPDRNIVGVTTPLQR